MIVAVTGHRPPKLGGYNIPNPTYDAVVKNIDLWLMQLQPSILISGMALGVDQWTADVCIKNDIPFVAAVPHDGYESMWPDFSKHRFYYLLQRAKKVEVINPGPYEKWKLHARNKWMVDHCDVLLAVWDGSKGGTGSCVEYAKNRGVEIVFVDLPKNIPPPVMKQFPLQFQQGGGHGKWTEMDFETMPSMPKAVLEKPKKHQEPHILAPKPHLTLADVMENPDDYSLQHLGELFPIVQVTKQPPTMAKPKYPKPQPDPDPKLYEEAFVKTVKQMGLSQLAKMAMGHPLDGEQESPRKEDKKEERNPYGRYVDLGDD